jgi:hypothetical protein
MVPWIPEQARAELVPVPDREGQVVLRATYFVPRLHEIAAGSLLHTPLRSEEPVEAWRGRHLESEI